MRAFTDGKDDSSDIKGVHGMVTLIVYMEDSDREKNSIVDAWIRQGIFQFVGLDHLN